MADSHWGPEAFPIPSYLLLLFSITGISSKSTPYTLNSISVSASWKTQLTQRVTRDGLPPCMALGKPLNLLILRFLSITKDIITALIVLLGGLNVFKIFMRVK